MREFALVSLAVLALLACEGVVRDVSKGANSTEREVNGRKAQPVSDEGGAAPSGSADPAK